MFDLAWNRHMWQEACNWEAGGEEWSLPWGGSEAQWFGCIYPRVHRFLPADRVLELAPGGGRWTQFLLPAVNIEYFGVDISQECVTRCRERFGEGGKASFATNDGLSLDMVPDEVWDFVFSFDSLVHAEIDVMQAYIPQILRKLRPEGVAFIHHSNWLGSGAAGANPHCRAVSVSAEAVGQLVEVSGGRMLVQEVLDWGDPPCPDCFSLFARRDRHVETAVELVRHTRFMAEASIIRQAQSPYSKAAVVTARPGAGAERVSTRAESHAIPPGPDSAMPPLAVAPPRPDTAAADPDAPRQGEHGENPALADQTRLEDLEAQLRALDARLSELLGSNSWRVTAPLRALKRATWRGMTAGHRWVRGLFGTSGQDREGLGPVDDGDGDGHHGDIDPQVEIEPGGEGGRGDRVETSADHEAGGDSALGSQGVIAGFHPSARFRDGERPFEPEVTVIVPTYNHQQFLTQRLESVYRQTYGNLRVILLDDGSTDNSRPILEAYWRAYPSVTELHVNAMNNGRPLEQWQRGIEYAEGDLIWIAEGSDYCQENFLQVLVPWFRDEAVQLAYSHTVFVDPDGQPVSITFEDYVAELGGERWQDNYIEATHLEVMRALGRKNPIPSVSGVVFRRPQHPALLKNEEWNGLRWCGDWILYLHLGRGGKIAFSRDTTNYHRYYLDTTPVGPSMPDAYYREHAVVATTMARLYDAPAAVLEAHRDIARRCWRESVGTTPEEAQFTRLYDPVRVRRAAGQRRPNILMVGLAFSTGGGEIVPIRLAEALRTRGYGVTFFDFHGEPANPRIRKMLPADIPVIEHDRRRGCLDDLVEEFGIEIVHTHNARADLYFVANLKRARRRVRHIATTHGMYEAQEELTVDGTLPFIAMGVDMWVYLSDKNLVPFQQRGLYRPERFVKIANPMAPRMVKPVRRERLGIAEEAFIVCLASRAVPEKGWREAIDLTIEARAASGKNIQLLLLGDGPLWDALQREMLPTYVHLLGFRENPVDYYAMADIGLLPSRFKGESFPMAVLDCLMAGRPMIASDVGEVRQMLTGDDGEIAGGVFPLVNGEVPIGKVAEMIAGYACDAGRYAAAQALAGRVVGRFRMETVIEQYEAVYETARARPAAAEV